MIRNIMWMCAALALAACMTPLETSPALDRYEIVTPALPALERAVWGKPALQSLRGDFLAAASRLDDSALNYAPTVSGAVQGGVTDDGGPSAEVGAVLSLNYDQVLNDFGRSEVQRAQAEIELEAQQVAYALAADDIFAQLARAQVHLDTARRKIAVIERQLERFAQREDQIEQAAAMGVLTNSDLLDIKDARNQIGQTLSLITAERDLARLTIDEVLGPSVQARAQLERVPAAVGRLSLDHLPQWRRARSELLLTQSDQAVDAILASSNPRVTLQGGVTQPLDDDEARDVFVGVRWDFSIYDGGRAAQEAQSQRLTSQALAAQVVAEREGIAAARDQLRVTERGLEVQRSALRNQISLSRERVDLFEQLLLAGRSDVGRIAGEILAQANAELALVDLERQSALAIIGYAQQVGGTCDLFGACAALHLRWQEVPDVAL